MEQSVEVHTHRRLLRISIGLHEQMAEIQNLRELVRSAEAARPSQPPLRRAVIAAPATELRV